MHGSAPPFSVGATAGLQTRPVCQRTNSLYGIGHGKEQRISKSCRSSSEKSLCMASHTTTSSTFMYSCVMKFRMSAASRHGTFGYFALASSETIFAASPTIVTYLSAAAILSSFPRNCSSVNPATDALALRIASSICSILARSLFIQQPNPFLLQMRTLNHHQDIYETPDPPSDQENQRASSSGGLA